MQTSHQRDGRAPSDLNREKFSPYLNTQIKRFPAGSEIFTFEFLSSTSISKVNRDAQSCPNYFRIGRIREHRLEVRALSRIKRKSRIKKHSEVHRDCIRREQSRMSLHNGHCQEPTAQVQSSCNIACCRRPTLVASSARCSHRAHDGLVRLPILHGIILCDEG